VFPILIGHTHAFELAIDHTLTAIYTTVTMIFQDKAFCSTVQNDELNGLGWTILGTQTAASASLGVIEEFAAIASRRRDLFLGIHLSGRFFIEGLEDILQHGSDFHNG
jgi:hypothetical protein